MKASKILLVVLSIATFLLFSCDMSKIDGSAKQKQLAALELRDTIVALSQNNLFISQFNDNCAILMGDYFQNQKIDSGLLEQTLDLYLFAKTEQLNNIEQLKTLVEIDNQLNLLQSQIYSEGCFMDVMDQFNKILVAIKNEENVENVTLIFKSVLPVADKYKRSVTEFHKVENDFLAKYNIIKR